HPATLAALWHISYKHHGQLRTNAPPNAPGCAFSKGRNMRWSSERKFTHWKCMSERWTNSLVRGRQLRAPSKAKPWLSILSRPQKRHQSKRARGLAYGCFEPLRQVSCNRCIRGQG